MGILFRFLPVLWLTLAAAGAEIAVTFPGKPFGYTSKRVEVTPEYEVYRFQYVSPGPSPFKEAKDVIAYYYKPVRMAGKTAPAVLCLHILGGNGDITRLIASYFARRGMPALMPVMPMFLERVPAAGRTRALSAPGGGRMLGETFCQIPGDIRKSIDLLASFPEVDPARIHLLGTSWGGILGVSTAGRDSRIDKAAFLLAGGDLQSVMNLDTKEARPIAKAIRSASPEDRAYIDRAIAGIEPMNYVSVLIPKARAGKIRMINAAEDEVIPLENSRRLAEALGLVRDRDFIVLPGLSHYSAIAALPKLLQDLSEYFGGDALLPLPEHPATTDAEVIKQVFSEMNAFLRWNPPDGKELRLSARFESFRSDKLEYSGFVTLRRGPGGRFFFQLEDAVGLKEVERFCFGRGEYPWFQSRDGSVFAGTLSPENRQNMELLLSGKWRIIQQTGILLSQLVAASGRMEALEKFVSIRLAAGPDGKRGIRIGEKKLDAFVGLEEERNVPSSVRVRNGKSLTRVIFTCWNSDSPYRPADFNPPPAEKVRNVDCRTLERVLASSMNFLIEARFDK